jgi:hypothetical protein
MGEEMAFTLGLGLPQREGFNLRTDVVDVARAADTSLAHRPGRTNS